MNSGAGKIHTVLLVVLLSVLSVAYLMLYSSTWLDMERVWRSSATYNHCYLILPISLYFFYRNRQASHGAVESSHWLWLPASSLLLLQLVWLFGYAADIALFMHVAAVMTLQALIWLALGSSRARQQRFALGYLLFLVPFGEELSPFLQNITADLTVSMLHLVQVPIYREGLYLATPAGLFEVAEACSGLRFLIASLAISVLFAHLHYRKLYKQCCFVVFMALLSVLANGIRAFMLVYIGEKSNMQLGFGADHYLYGWLFFGLVLLAGFWLGARFADPQITDTGAKRTQVDYPSTTVHRLALTAATVALLLTLSYRLSLQVTVPPVTANVIPLPFANAAAQASNWGIHFTDSLLQAKGEDSAGTEYFIAQYANKQQQGELISWHNQLYDKQRWQVQQRILGPEHAILQLKSLSGQHRTLLYWYQVGKQRSVSEFDTKLHQACNYLSDDHSTSSVFAVSVAAAPSEAQLQRLHQAARLLAGTDLTRLQLSAGAADD